MRKNYWRNNLHGLALAFLFVFISKSATSQMTDVAAVYWLKYQNQLNFSPKFWWTNEFDNRRFIKPDIQNQFIFHSRAHYKKNRWDYAGGLTLSWAYASKPESPMTHATFEIRPVMEVNYEIPFKSWSLSQRLRVDHRFIEEDRFGSIDDPTNYIMRLRYRIGSRITLKRSESGEPRIVGKIADEIMFNHEENTFDQNRIYTSAEFTLSKYWVVETGYIYIYQQRFGRDEFLTRHVLRLSLLHRIFLSRG